MRISINFEMTAVRIGVLQVGSEEFSRQNKKLLWLLEALIKCNRSYLQSHPFAPTLYKSGVKYQREPRGQEEWQDIACVLESGSGDCEDLVAWRAAELREQGVHAKGFLKWYHLPKELITLYHVQIRLPDGTIEDPSALLGMRGKEE